MFKLYESFEDTIEFDGKTYQIDMSFDVILYLFEILDDDELRNEEKIYIAMSLLIGSDETDSLHPEQMLAIFSRIKDEHIALETPNQMYDLNGEPVAMPGQSKAPSYSLTHDAEHIYTSFIKAYGIDLHEQLGHLHWHKFSMLLRDLPEDTKFKRVIEIREWKAPKGATSEERQKMRELKKLYALPTEKGEGD